MIKFATKYNLNEIIGFEKCNKIFLCVSNFNDSARNLYQKYGFKKVGVVESLHVENIDEEIMMKTNVV